MIAALQMYDWPEVQPRTDAFWARVRASLTGRCIDAPERLSRPGDISAPWRDRALLLGQTCGLPYVSGRCGHAVLLTRPDYGLEHANGGTYQSALICRKDESAEDLRAFRGRIAAVNEYGSQSGCNALADAVQRAKLDDGRAFFSEVALSGSHRESARMVAERQADIAAVDAVAWALFGELEPVRHARLRVLGWTRVTPALPFIISRENAHLTPAVAEALWDAVGDSLNGPPVGIPHGFLPVEADDYDPIRKMAERVQGLKLAPNARRLGI